MLELNKVFYIKVIVSLFILFLLIQYDLHFVSYSQFNYNNIIDFLSKSFDLIDKQKIFSLHKSVIFSILSNQNLHIESEDFLLDFIM